MNNINIKVDVSRFGMWDDHVRLLFTFTDHFFMTDKVEVYRNIPIYDIKMYHGDLQDMINTELRAAIQDFCKHVIDCAYFSIGDDKLGNMFKYFYNNLGGCTESDSKLRISLLQSVEGCVLHVLPNNRSNFIKMEVPRYYMWEEYEDYARMPNKESFEHLYACMQRSSFRLLMEYIFSEDGPLDIYFPEESRVRIEDVQRKYC